MAILVPVRWHGQWLLLHAMRRLVCQYQEFLDKSKYSWRALINHCKVFNIRLKKVLWNLNYSCVALSSWGSRRKLAVLHVLLNIVHFLLLQPLEPCMYWYQQDQQARERQLISLRWGSQLHLRLAAGNIRAIASYISLTEAEPYPAPCLGIIGCSQPTYWLDDRQKRGKKERKLSCAAA